MRKKYSIVALLTIIVIHVKAQGILVNAGTSLKTTSNVSVVIFKGGLTNNGTVDFNAADVILTGDRTVFLSGNNAISFRNLIINKTSGNVLLNRDVNVTNQVSFITGKIDLNGYNLLLSSSALLINETNNNRIIGLTGEVRITLNMNKPVSANPGNLGAILTSNVNVGNVTVARGHAEQTLAANNKSIKRYYEIKPNINTNLAATLRFTYFNAELNGLQENLFTMYAYKNNAWINEGFTTKSASSNYVELSNMSSFAKHTLGITNNNLVNVDEHSAVIPHVKEAPAIMLMPNPVTSEALLCITFARRQQATISVYNSSGIKVWQQEKYVEEGLNKISINVSNLQSGIYYLNVFTSDGKHEKISFQKL